MKELKKEYLQKAIAWLKNHRLPAREKPVEDEIRKDRDSHNGILDAR